MKVFKSFLVQFVFLFSLSSVTNAAGYRLTHFVADSGAKVNHIEINGVLGLTEWRYWMSVSSSIDPSLDTLVTIESRGGAVPGGLALIWRIEDFVTQQLQNGKRVAVLSRGVCASMCVPVFFAFPERYMTQEARIGLHGVSAGGLAHDQQQTDWYVNNLRSMAEKRGQNNFLSWIEKMVRKSVFASSELTFLSGQELLSQDSGLISREGSVQNKEQLF